MTMDIDPWAPAPQVPFNWSEGDALDRTTELPDLPPPPANQPVTSTGPTAVGTDEPTAVEVENQPRSKSRIVRGWNAIDRATGPAGWPVVRPVGLLVRATPTGWKARSESRSERINRPRSEWLATYGPGLEATLAKIQAGDLRVDDDYQKWLAKEAGLQALVDDVAKRERKTLLVSTGVITVTVLVSYFLGRYWLWPLLLVPFVVAATWIYRLGRDGQAFDRAVEVSSDRGRSGVSTGRSTAVEVGTDRGRNVEPTGRSGEPTAVGTGNQPVDQPRSEDEPTAVGTVGPEPLHPLAARLDEGLRVLKVYKKAGDAIGASTPLDMRVANGSPNGTSFVATLPMGVIASQIVSRHDEIAGVFDTTDEHLILLPAGGSNRALWVWKCDHHPLGGQSTWSPIPDEGETNVWKGWRFGFTITNQPVLISPMGERILVAGSSGCGKSGAVNDILLGFMFDPCAEMLLMDPEGFGAWDPLTRIGTVMSGSDPASLRSMADKLVWVVEKLFPLRQAEIAKVRQEQRGLLHGRDEVNEDVARHPRYELHALLIAIEEVTSLVNALDEDTKKKARWALGEIARRSGKYGISLVLVSQKPTNDQLPSFIVANSSSKYLMACKQPTQAKAIIDDYAEKGMNPVGMLTPTDRRGEKTGTPGAGYLEGGALLSPSEPWVLMRTDDVSGEHLLAAIDPAYQLRLAKRPDLLPDSPKDVPSGQDDGVAPQGPAALALAFDDPEHLEAIAGVFREGELELWSSTIIARLREEYPADPTYRNLTPRGMNGFLEPFKLVAKPAYEDGHPRKGLKLSAVNDALERTYNAARTQDPAFALRSDENVPLTSTSTQERTQAISETPPEKGPKQHLGQVPLPPANAAFARGGFS